MRIGIVGYGNLGRSLELIAKEAEEIELTGVFTRRSTKDVKTFGVPVFSFFDIEQHADDVDVLCLCHGSSDDLPKYAPMLAEHFNTVDTFDNHAAIPDHKARVDKVARDARHTALVSLGWDPGFLSLIRLYSSSFIPGGCVNTFWGRGVSQGHSEALRRINGVKKAVQYTVPREDAVTLAGLVAHPFSDTDRHRRVCYVVAEKEERIS